MDISFTDGSILQRSFSFNPQISHVGYVKKKNISIKRSFSSINFSFILSGTGFYKFEEETYEVKSPCVFIQCPNVDYHYEPHGTWEELYFIYDEKYFSFFKDNFQLDPQNPIWSVDIQNYLAPLEAMSKKIQQNIFAQHLGDNFDMACFNLIHQALIQKNTFSQSQKDNKWVLSVYESLKRDFKTLHSVQPLIEATKIPEISFRRHWENTFSLPPHQHLLQLKLQYCAKKLIETSEKIQDIAREVGYDDPLYFSRLFKKSFLISPNLYRKNRQNYFLHSNQKP